MTLYLILLIVFVNGIWSFELSKPKCENCNSYISNPNDSNLGRCKIFTNKIETSTGEKLIYNYAKHCRDNDFLCGENGWLFDSINNNIDDNDFLCGENEWLFNLINNIDDNDFLCGENEWLFDLINNIDNNNYINLMNSQKNNEIEKNTNDLINDFLCEGNECNLT